MEAIKFVVLSLKARVACALFGVVASIALLSALFVVFAAASGELDPVVAAMAPAASSNAVASRAPLKPSPG